MGRHFFIQLNAELRRYLLAGGLAFLVDAGLVFGLTEVAGWHYMVSATAGFAAGLVVNYLLCIRWVFSHRALENRRLEMTIFASIGLVGLLLNDGVIWLLTEGAGIHYMASKLAATGVVFAFNFLSRKLMLFTHWGQLSADTPAEQA
ncbi:MAG: GtrA family protein [Pseudomonadota bacterium]